MSEKHPEVEAWFAGLSLWQKELSALRDILLQSGLTETFKWHFPVYACARGNVAIIWDFKDRAALGFFKGVLLPDPKGILEAPGENSRSQRVVNFTSLEQVERLRPILMDYLRDAIAIEMAGQKVDLPKDDLEYPTELVDHLDTDTTFRTAFEALTPGRRRSWVLHFSQPKQAETRTSRIVKATPKVLAGKGMNDR